MTSRLNSHLNESSPTVFHSGLGKVDPISVRLELARGIDELTSEEEHVAFLAALLHERHHWLQHVGTSAGLFGTTLLEIQSGMIERVPLEELRAEDLPLLGQEQRFGDALDAWERLEATRRLYFGCRRGDLDVLTRDGRAPLWGELVPLLRATMGKLLADSPHIAGYEAFLDNRDQHLPVVREMVEESGWSLGARHLMEGAARQSEMYRLLSGAIDSHVHSGAPTETFAFNISRHRTGVYGVARKVFDHLVRDVTLAADVGFSFACDLALNVYAPPFYPFVPINPGTFFVHVVKTLEDFRFDRVIDVTDPSHVRELIAELTEHVRMGELDLTLPVRFKRDMTDALLGHLHPDEVAEQIFTVPEPGHMPVPTGPSSRLRYLLALTAQAERIRTRSPEIFVFPSASYLHDRAAFREVFQQIRPPLLSYGTNNLQASRPDPGWADFFVATGIHYELMRGLVMYDARALGIRLAPYLHPHTGSFVQRVLQGALRGSPAADVIWHHAEAAAAQP